ncbi:MAG: tRNA pseudouridine(13) synthase TruD [gamma proteobacterium symbiont of Bathyaustriella thionipta]|nr:tRNA pseudouridine(13) synthase TruD [gamma proteobacterium symbiont of Bathyaustriella thionipta]
MAVHVDALPYAYGRPAGRARIKTRAEDFQVDEIPYVAAAGQGEHLYVRIRKRGTNTAWLAQQLAQLAGITDRDVGYAGLKDRQALTTQWFSLHLPKGEMPDLSALENEDIQVLESVWSEQKLHPGDLSGNRFQLILREVSASDEEMQKRSGLIQQQGVPNYFMAQRFGHNDHNLQQAERLLNGKIKLKRSERGFLFSAARSLLFNLVLAERVRQNNWNQVLQGDWLSINGTDAGQMVFAVNEELSQRVDKAELHPSGPLWGKDCEHEHVRKAAATLEKQALAAYQIWQQGLERFGLRCDRRPLRVIPQSFSCQKLAQDQWQLDFQLPPGSYATALVRELVTV